MLIVQRKLYAPAPHDADLVLPFALRQKSRLRTAGFFSAAFDTNVTEVESALPNAPNIGR